MKSFVISLTQNNKSRRESIISAFSKANCSFEFFNAITYANILSAEIDTGVDFSGTILTESEKGCILSHIKIWLMMIENDIPHVAIFEDDIHLSHSASTFLSSSDWLPEGVDVIKLEKSNKYYNPFRHNFKVADNRNLYKMKEINWGSAGYIITRKAAESLISRFRKSKDLYTADFELFCQKKNHDISYYMLEPAICIQDFTLNKHKFSKFPSTIETKRSSCTKTKINYWGKIKRELSRLNPIFIIYRNIISKRTKYR